MKWLLIWFLTLGMYGMYSPAEMTVTDVSQGMVTLEAQDGSRYMIEEAEAWRIGDRAECIVRKDEIVLIKYGGWKK